MLHICFIHYILNGTENTIRIESSLRSDLIRIVRDMDYEGVTSITFDKVIK